eukprot:Lithocolla_globosa_v1_NODE_6595_length_1061_cov_214.957256.p1 type:complete len:173 gc:universal NODE_6595_length_1061_cov_214.957256:397-915(+)
MLSWQKCSRKVTPMVMVKSTLRTFCKSWPSKNKIIKNNFFFFFNFFGDGKAKLFFIILFLLGHDLQKVLKVDFTITIGVTFLEHFCQLSIVHLLSYCLSKSFQLGQADGSTSLFHQLECGLDVSVSTCISGLTVHHGKEISEVKGPLAVGVNFSDQVFEFAFSCFQFELFEK